MIIKDLLIKEGFKRKYFEFDKRNLIYSDINTQGKTTAVRLLLHSLGFPIPAPAKMDFARIYTKVEIETNNILYSIERTNYNIRLTDAKNEYNFILPNDQKKLHSIIFNVDELYLLENILGAMYVDQTRGTVVINRGDVIGNNNFQIEKFIAGLEGRNVDELTRKIADEQKKLREYKSVCEIAKYREENKLFNEQVERETNKENHIDLSDISLIESKIQRVKKKLKNTKDTLSKNNTFVDMIEGYNLFVKDKKGNDIPVNSQTLLGFDDNNEMLRMQIKLYEIELKDLERNLDNCKAEIKEGVLLNVEEYKQTIDQQLKSIDVDFMTISRIVEQSSQTITMLKKKLKDCVKENSSVVDYTNSVMLECAKKLGVDSYIEKNGIFTNKIQNKSGAVAYKIIIAFKVAFIKAVEKYKNIKLPIIIDSLRNTELDEINAELILNLIAEELPENQMIIASIFQFKEKYFDKKHKITYPLINE